MEDTFKFLAHKDIPSTIYHEKIKELRSLRVLQLYRWPAPRVNFYTWDKLEDIIAEKNRLKQ